VTVKDVIEYAKHSELNQLAVKDDLDALLAYINLGVLELYKRFNLKNKEVLVELKENITTYTLPEDCIKIEAIYNNLGMQLPINEENDIYAVMTPTYNTIQVPFPIAGVVLSIIYVAAPTKVIEDTDLIPLPEQFLEPLLQYIGYKAHASINATTEQGSENNAYYIRFEASCKRIKDLGLLNNDIDDRPIFKIRGFC